jgi:hypothetical protein
MRAALVLGASLMLVAPACADPGWYAEDGPLGAYADNDEDLSLSVWCNQPDAPPLEFEYADFNDDVGGIDRDITSGTLVIAAGKSAPKRFTAKYEDDNTDFLLTGADARAAINLALLGNGLTVSVEIKGKRYSRGVFSNTGMDKAAPALRACLAQTEGKP